MRVAAIDSYGDRPTIREVPSPKELQADELLVRVLAAGMNPVDTLIAGGAMKVPARFPLTLGSDFAGRIERIGASVTEFREGDAVYGRLTDDVLQQGAYGDYVHVAETGCVSRIPDSLGIAQAAALPTAAMTALLCVDAAAAFPLITVVVNGATGGVGSFAVPLLAKRGATVVATAHDDGIAHVLSRGATTAIDYRREKLADGVKERFGGGIDSVIDLVSREMGTLDALARLVRPSGTVVSTLGAADIDAFRSRNVRATNILLHPSAELLARVTKAVDAGDLPPAPLRAYPLERVDEALAELRRGHVHGKLILATSP
jgi:NADPH:quinone reductase-like Zn-dependent oxidoreductase